METISNISPLNDAPLFTCRKPFILIVDDEPLIGQSLTRLFSRKGYEVRAVATSTAAINIALNNPPDVAILDIQLDGPISGIHLGMQFKALSIPFVYMTGFISEHIYKQIAPTNPLAIIDKAHTSKEIFNFIDKVIHEAHFATAQ